MAVITASFDSGALGILEKVTIFIDADTGIKSSEMDTDPPVSSYIPPNLSTTTPIVKPLYLPVVYVLSIIYAWL